MEAIFDIVDAGKGAALVGGRTWEYAEGISGGPGVSRAGDGYAIATGPGGVGAKTAGPLH
jgi:hypothetical protein